MNAAERKKRDAWNIALGLMKIDVEPTQEFLDEVEKEIRGETTPEEMLKTWEQRHTKPKK